jgi:hypothetical protein
LLIRTHHRGTESYAFDTALVDIVVPQTDGKTIGDLFKYPDLYDRSNLTKKATRTRMLINDIVLLMTGGEAHESDDEGDEIHPHTYQAEVEAIASELAKYKVTKIDTRKILLALDTILIAEEWTG